ncbi:hypothetical protein [Streptomyces zhihengii]|uniref:hypothetical protein n=1 Tax=Streptomyces zhihengii TaxID=1818004 RepID=UPI0033B0EE7B
MTDDRFQYLSVVIRRSGDRAVEVAGGRAVEVAGGENRMPRGRRARYLRLMSSFFQIYE